MSSPLLLCSLSCGFMEASRQSSAQELWRKTVWCSLGFSRENLHSLLQKAFEGEIPRLRQTDKSRSRAVLTGQEAKESLMPRGDREAFLDRGWVHSERDRDREMLTSQCPQDLSVLYLIHDAPRDVVHVSWELTSLWVTIANEEVLCFRLEFTSICGIASSSAPPWACLPGLPWLAVHHRLGWTAFSIFIWRLHNGIFSLLSSCCSCLC